jgi:hypothetical protein
VVKQLNQQGAQAPDKENKMYKFLNAKGEAGLHAFLSKYVKGFEAHSFDDWISAAEAVSMNSDPKEDFIIEVSRAESTTGNPETLKMPPYWFFTQ